MCLQKGGLTWVLNERSSNWLKPDWAQMGNSLNSLLRIHNVFRYHDDDKLDHMAPFFACLLCDIIKTIPNTTKSYLMTSC